VIFCLVHFWQFFAGFVFGNFLPGSFLTIFCWLRFWQFFARFVFGDFLLGLFLAIFSRVCFWQFFAWFVFGNFLPGSFLAIFCQVRFRQFLAGFVFGIFLPGLFLAIFCQVRLWQFFTFCFWQFFAWFVFGNFLPGLFLAIFCRGHFWQFFTETRIRKRTRLNSLLKYIFFSRSSRGSYLCHFVVIFSTFVLRGLFRTTFEKPEHPSLSSPKDEPEDPKMKLKITSLNRAFITSAQNTIYKAKS